METKKKGKTGWKIVRIAARGLAAIGAGMVVGAGLAGIDTSKHKGLAKLAITLGSVALADYCGEIAGNQIEKRVSDAEAAFDFGQSVADKLCPDPDAEEAEKTEES